MKKMKKLLAVLMTLVMVMGLGMTSLADDVIGNADDTGTITVNGIDAESGLSVVAYQIIKADYENDNFAGYSVVYPTVEPAVVVDENITLEHLNAIIAADKVEGTTYSMTQSGDSYVAEVPVGTYLVVVSNAETKIYNPMIVSVNYVNVDGKNAIVGDTIATIADGNAWIKESGLPTFTKVEADVNGNTTNENAYGNSINVGSDVAYTLTIGSVPYYGGSHPVFNVVDTLDASLTYKGDLAVTVDGNALKEGKDYTLTVDGQVITVNFVVEGKYTLNGYQGKNVVITYKATLNDKAKFNNEANVNTATLTFTKDSKKESADKEITVSTYTYTFDITSNILKVDEAGKPLSGAKFVFYTKETIDGSVVDETYNNLLMDKALVTDANGRIQIKGLEAGTYYLKETEAPAGYSVNTQEFKVDVEATYGDDGKLASYTVKVDNQQVSELKIVNTKLSALPSTGGIGTTIFTLGGCAIMVAAAYMYFVSRRREEEQ